MPPSPSPRDTLATWGVRAVNGLSRVTGRGSGTVIGGRVGLAISPHLLAGLAQRREVVLVSGTNGKTTTTAMVATGWGGDVASNTTGSNMPAGHVAALVASRAARVVLEVDESWLGEVARATSPRVIALLNLSRDQLDRANEVRRIAERWRSLVAELRDVTLVANANDPLIVFAAELAREVLWCDVPTPWTTDAVSCPRCTEPLHFSGATWWSECGFQRPETLDVSLRDGLVVRGESLSMTLRVPGAFNEANAAMALGVLSCVGVAPVDAMDRISEITSVAGRFSVRRWGEHRLRLLLAKNPAGFSAMLATLEDDGTDVWVAINARVADGHDPSWLYDVPFEVLRGHRVFCFGERRLDLATRLEYANVDYVVVEDDTDLPTSHETIDVVGNYTAFQDWRERTTPC